MCCRQPIDSLMTTRLKSIILRALLIKHSQHLTTKEYTHGLEYLLRQGRRSFPD